jgi:hypothetical protein
MDLLDRISNKNYSILHQMIKVQKHKMKKKKLV